MTWLRLISSRPLGAIALNVLSLLSGVALLAVSGWLITRASQQPPLMYLQMAIVGVRAFALSKAFFRYIGRLRSHDGAFRRVALVRSEILRRIIPFGPDGLVRLGRGNLNHSLVRDADALADWPLRVVEPAWAHALSVVVACLAVATVSPILALILFLVIAVMVLFSVMVERESSRVEAHTVTPLLGEIADTVAIVVDHIDILDAYEARGLFRDAIRERDQRVIDAQLRSAFARSRTAALWVASGGAVALGVALTRPTFDSPVLVALALVVLGVADIASAIPSVLDARRRVVASANRLDRMIPEVIPPEIPQPVGNGEALENVSTIDVHDVTVRHPNSAKPACAGVTFTAGIGDVVQISGPSGSGKTSLAHALVRFLDHEGTITIGGVDVRHRDPEVIHRVVGLCEQDPHIFGTTIRHNLDFAREGISDDELWNVLERVRLADWARQQGGLDRDLGAHGERLSGGQAQRIALARVLLANKPIVIVDEPTAHLDRETATAMWADLAAATEDRILIVISHDQRDIPRLSVRVTL